MKRERERERENGGREIKGMGGHHVSLSLSLSPLLPLSAT